jgi:hypothetical protein
MKRDDLDFRLWIQDKRKILYFASVFLLLSFIWSNVRFAPARVIKVLLQVDKDEVKRIDQVRKPKLSRLFYTESVEFPPDTYLHYRDGPPVGFDRNFFMDLEARFIVINPGKYTFRVRSDDGFRLVIDRTPLMSHPEERAANMDEGSIELAAGPHQLWLSYFQRSGPAALEAAYIPPREETAYPIGWTSNAIHFETFR